MLQFLFNKIYFIWEQICFQWNLKFCDGSLRNALKSDLIGWKRRISHNCFLGNRCTMQSFSFLYFSILGMNTPTKMSLFKVNNSISRKNCEICSTLTIKTPEHRQCCRCGVFIINFEHISTFFLMFLLLPLSVY